MKATTQAEGRPYYLNWELQKAAEKLLREIMMVKPGETVLITCDTTNDERVINATAGAALTMGAYPIVMQYPASLEQAIMIEPTKPVLEAIKAADVWIEYDYQLFYTRGWKQAMDCGTRQITAASMDINMMLNVIGRFDHKKIVELGERLVVLHNEAKQMRITSPGGTDLTFACEGRLCNQSGTYAAPGTSVMLSGQTSMCPIEETINGTIVFDGGLFPPQEIGLGTQGEGLGGKSWVAANHTDGIILNPSIYCDGKAIEENGFYVDPECVRICGELGVAGY